MRLPKAQIIIGFKEVYNEHPPIDRISLLVNIDRKSLLVEIAGLNYRIKTKREISYNCSEEFQLKELEYFSPTTTIHRTYLNIFKKFTTKIDGSPVYFCRQGCLFALEEIANSDRIPIIENFNMARPEVWEAILKYLLAVNSFITNYQNQNEIIPGFEDLNTKLLALNELAIETDPFYTPFRGYWLLKHFEKDPKYKEELTSYLDNAYGMNPGQFIYSLLNLYFTNEQPNEDLNFVYKPTEKATPFIEQLSKTYSNSETIKLLSIRKYPFLKVDEGEYILTDTVNLIEKSYNQYLNDFWFDWLKNKRDSQNQIIFNTKDYHGVIGQFFEKYIKVLMESCFCNYRYSNLLMFNNLKAKNHKGKEMADIYLRFGNKIIIGEVKSGYIYDKEKYGGDVNALYKNNRDKFFSDFGINQIISQINRLAEDFSELDPGIPVGHQLKIYPVIILNDKAFQTPLMADIFNKRFSELRPSISLPKINLKPLSLIHVNDLERLEKILIDSPKQIWAILDYHTIDRRFMPAFYSTVFHFLRGTKYSQRVLELHKKLITYYRPNDEDAEFE